MNERKTIRSKVNNLKAVMLPDGTWICGLVKNQTHQYVVLYPCTFKYLMNKSLNTIELKFNLFDPVVKPSSLILDNLGVSYNLDSQDFAGDYMEYVSAAFDVQFADGVKKRELYNDK